MDYKIDISPAASQDLDEIVTYITKDLGNPAAAAAFLNEVKACYDSLEKMPLMYEACRDPQLRSLGYRRAVIKHYVMVYRIDNAENIVHILRFFYGAREYEKLI